jgi:formamidopyrimidine-DNA glycosylase
MLGCLEEFEIVRMYKQAKNKPRQIEILADLTATSVNDIIEILRKEGVFDEKLLVYYKPCAICGRLTVIERNVKYCPRCYENGARQRKRHDQKRYYLNKKEQSQ